MRLDEHGFSPRVLKMIAKAMGRLHSDSQAAFAVNWAGIDISRSQVQRIAKQLGAELAQERDAKAVLRRRRELPVRAALTPEAAVVETDGGRLRTRASGQGPGVHDVQGKEDKAACFITLKSEPREYDPEPEPPPGFLEPRRVHRLVQQMKGSSGGGAAEGKAAENAAKTAAAEEASVPDAEPSKKLADYQGRPKPLVRTCVASMADSDRFGPMMAAEAQERGFYEAKRKAFLGDGAKCNWSIHRGYFPDFEPIVDFMHVLCYIYRGAGGVVGAAEHWATYAAWMRACWQGRVGEVIEELQQAQGRLGDPPEDEALDANDPRNLVAEALSYLRNNRERMDYPRYRRQGLPITSSWVESLVGEFNARVKSPQKFWNRPDGPEAILQLRAAVLSEDDRLNRFFDQRPGHPYRSRRPAAA